MGTEGIKIADLDVKKLITDLNKAYCDEWVAFYLYWYMGKTVSGFGYEDMSEFLIKTAEKEFEHAGEVAERIVQLGGMPVADIAEISKSANVPYPMVPEKTDDYSAIIETVLKSEAGAIKVYNRLAQQTAGKDHVTYQLAMHILTEEVEHEETFENLVEKGRPLPMKREFAGVAGSEK